MYVVLIETPGKENKESFCFSYRHGRNDGSRNERGRNRSWSKEDEYIKEQGKRARGQPGSKNSGLLKKVELE